MKTTVGERGGNGNDHTAGSIAPPSDRIFRLLVEGVTDYAIFLLDPRGIIATWNAGAERMKAYTASQAIGRHFSMLYSERDRELGMPEKALATALREGRYESEGWRLRQNGSRFWASVVIDRLHDEAGDLIGYAKITRDLSERRSAQEALKESEARFGMLVQGVTDYAIYMLDAGGHISNWNSGGERIKGYRPDEVLHKHFSMFYTEADRAEGLPQRALATAAREGRYEAEGWRVRKNGEQFWAGVVIDPIRNSEGEIVGYAKVTRDLTERRTAEEHLRQSQKMEAIGQLTGGVAHDFNNLLTVIASNTDLLTQPNLDEKTKRKLVAGIQRATERGATLTQQLLAFARRQPLRPETHSVRLLIGNFEVVLRRAAGDLVELKLELGRGPDFTTVDAPQFEAALLNLIVNARDALPGGGIVTITTRVTRDEDELRHANLSPGEYVVMRVKDNGVGMSPETVTRAFEPFYTTKEIGKGSGLGLSQVFGFVAQSGGGIKIDSSLGKGTTIAVYLPVDSEAQRNAVAGAAERDGRRTSTVLIVEDDPDVLETAVAIMTSLGFDVLTASDGVAALDTLQRENAIELLFTDVMMPRGLSGIDLARHARQMRPDLKILLASGYPLSALAVQHGLIDEFSFIGKPYRWTEVSERLRAMRTFS